MCVLSLQTFEMYYLEGNWVQCQGKHQPKGKNYSMKHDSLKFHTTSDTMVLVERKKSQLKVTAVLHHSFQIFQIIRFKQKNEHVIAFFPQFNRTVFLELQQVLMILCSYTKLLVHTAQGVAGLVPSYTFSVSINKQGLSIKMTPF